MKLLTILFVFVTTFSFCQNATVKGTVPAGMSGRSIKLTLMNYETRKDKLQQEVKIEKGSFNLTIPLKEAAIYTIGIGDSSVLQILAKPNDVITVQIKKDAITSTGSLDTQYLIDYEAYRKKYSKNSYNGHMIRPPLQLRRATKRKSNTGTLSTRKLPKIIKQNYRNGLSNPFLSIRLQRSITVCAGIPIMISH